MTLIEDIINCQMEKWTFSLAMYIWLAGFVKIFRVPFYTLHFYGQLKLKTISEVKFSVSLLYVAFV